MMKAKKPEKTPGRAEYERLNPTFSTRVDRQTYESAKELCAKSGKSFADLIRELVGRQEPAVRGAYDQGFAAGRAKYLFSYPCVRCGMPIHLVGEAEKRQIAGFLKEEGWGHNECPGRTPH